jgi:hypothetical protein
MYIAFLSSNVQGFLTDLLRNWPTPVVYMRCVYTLSDKRYLWLYRNLYVYTYSCFLNSVMLFVIGTFKFFSEAGHGFRCTCNMFFARFNWPITVKGQPNSLFLWNDLTNQRVTNFIFIGSSPTNRHTVLGLTVCMYVCDIHSNVEIWNNDTPVLK